MALTLRQIRENTAAARELMARARSEKFAVGAFNIDNQETLKAVCRAAVAKNSPVLVELSHGEAKSIGLDNVRDMVDNYKAELGLEIYINLDHSPSVEDAIDGIEAGFEFIHIDISQGDHDASEEEIISKTKLVVDYARLTGALVESEPHYFAGKSEKFKKSFDYEKVKKTFSTPESAKIFVESTGVDTYAAAIGNLHGKYPVPKVLDLDLLGRIRAAIDCNISLHGGSGTPAHYFRDAVELGASKININSDMRFAFRDSLEKALKRHPDEIAVMKLMDEVISSVQAVVEDKIDMFGSAKKARP